MSQISLHDNITEQIPQCSDVSVPDFLSTILILTVRSLVFAIADWLRLSTFSLDCCSSPLLVGVPMLIARLVRADGRPSGWIGRFVRLLSIGFGMEWRPSGAAAFTLISDMHDLRRFSTHWSGFSNSRVVT